jgi:hypothetical protein
MATEYTSIEQLLVKEAGRIGPEIYRKTVDNNVWLKLIKQDTFPEEMGDRVSVLTYERSIPQAARNGRQNDFDLQSVWQGNTAILGSNPTDANYLNFNAYTQSPAGAATASTADNNNVSMPKFANVEFAQTLRTYDLRRVALESPNISLEDLRYPVRRKEQLTQIMNILTEQTALVWTTRYQDEYVRLAQNKITPTGLSADTASLNYATVSSDLSSFSPIVNATSKLTQGVLRRVYMRLLRDGAGSAAQGKENGAPVFNLITSAETSDDIIKLNDNIRSDFRYSTKPNELLAPLGVERSYGGFYHIIDPYPPRYNRVALEATAHADGVYTVEDSTGLEIGDVLTVTGNDGTTVKSTTSVVSALTATSVTITAAVAGPSATDKLFAWKRVFPFTRTSATKGNKYDINASYLSAAYEDSIILVNEVYHSVVPKPLGSMGQMGFDAQGYRGDFKWKNIPDRGTNPDGSVGFFRATFANGSKPVRPEWGYVIRHKRGEADLLWVA